MAWGFPRQISFLSVTLLAVTCLKQQHGVTGLFTVPQAGILDCLLLPNLWASLNPAVFA